MGSKKTDSNWTDIGELLELFFFVVAGVAWVIGVISRWSLVFAIGVPLLLTVAAVAGAVLIRRSARQRARRYARELYR